MNHEAIEELLAGYALRSLSGEDAGHADRLLSEHVPTCASCRDALDAFQAVTSELALAAAPVAAPETLLPRLHREMEPAGRRRRPVEVFVVAASVMAVVGLGGLAVNQGIRANHSAAQADQLKQALNFAGQPNAKMVPVGPATEVSQPGVQETYLEGTEVPMPRQGYVYRVWLISGTGATYVGWFLPEDGLVVLHLPYDASRYDRLEVTVEPVGSTPSQPGQIVWQAAG